MSEMRILIAKDAESDISSMEEILAAEGYSFDVATEFQDVQQKVLSHPYSLIFYLPPPAGRVPRGVWQFLREHSHEIPILFCAPADYSIADYQRWLEEGMENFLSLPVTKRQLLASIQSTLEAKNYRWDDKSVMQPTALPLFGGRVIKNISPLRVRNVIVSAFENCAHHQQVLKKAYRKTQIIEEATLAATAVSHRSEDRIKREDELIRAIEKKEFEMYYQPIVSLRDGKICGFEALVRWNNPEKGYISPSEFIPLAEETGLIIPLGLLAIDMTTTQLSEWNSKLRKQRPITSSVNLSPVQFIHPNLAEQISEIVEAKKLERELLRFEITESALMADMESANIMLLKLKSMKHKIYMDDFGTGYSSLSYLRHFPVDVLKIDQSFVKWMGVDEESDTIVRAIIELAHHLHMEVVAEGIETDEHAAKLREMNCDYGQGYFFSKPVSTTIATELLIADPQW
ncbi:MAG: EAL domain-containing protein [Spirochaetes bacterium]|nr:EAL domain-containing protein [Spirochaetota bacterium]